MKSYVVFDAPRGYLFLDGPFAYPRWKANQQDATVMTYAQAHANAAAFGGEVAPA